MNTTLEPHSSDIKTTSRLIRSLPMGWRPYAVLARLDRPIGIWLLLMPCLFALIVATDGMRIASGWEWALIPLLIAGSIIMRAAGCIINDLWDMNLDRRVRRTQGRPLASRALSPQQAVFFLLALLLVGFALLLSLGTAAILYGILAMLLVVMYPLAKRVTSWPQAVLGLTFNMGVPITWCAIHGATNGTTWALYAGCVLWTLAYDTIYAHQDQEDDERIGIGSTARLFGRHSRTLVGLFFIVAVGFWGGAALMAGPFGVWSLLPLMGLLLFALTVVLGWDPADPAQSLKAFQAQRDFAFVAGLYFFLMGTSVFS